MSETRATTRLLLTLFFVIFGSGNSLAVEDLLFESSFGGSLTRTLAARGDVVYLPAGSALNVLRLVEGEDPLLLQQVHIGNEVQDLELVGDDLHVAALQAYRRYQVLADGTLRETASMETERHFHHVSAEADLLLLNDLPPRGSSIIRLYRLPSGATTPQELTFLNLASRDQIVLGGKVHASRADGLFRFQLSEENTLVEEGHDPVPGGINPLIARDGHLLAGGSAGALRVYDIELPLSDGPVATLTLGDHDINDLTADGDFAFAQLGTQLITSVNISDIEAPTIADSFTTTDYIFAIAAAGDRVHNVSSSRARLESLLVSGDGTMKPERRVERPGPNTAIAEVDDLIFAAYNNVAVQSRLEIFRRRPHREPELIAGLPAVGEGELFLSALDLIGDLLIGYNSTSLRAIDVSDPTSPTLRSTFASGTLSGFAGTTGDHAVLFSGGQLRTISFADPDLPVEADLSSEPGLEHFTMALRGDTLASIVNESGARRIVIYRIGEDGSIDRRAALGSPSTSTRSITFSSDLLATINGSGGINLFRREEGDELTFLTTVRPEEGYRSVALDGNRLAALREDFATIMLLDVSNPNSVSLLAEQRFTQAGGHLVMDGGRILYVDTLQGVITLAVTDLPPTGFLLY